MDSGPLARAARLLQAGRRDEALALARQAAAAAPGDPRALTRAGEILGNAGAVDEARRCFEAALARDGDLPAACFNLALAQLAAGEPDQAIAQLERLLARHPDLAPAWLHLGGALNAAGRYAEAEAALRRHLAVAGPNGPGLTWLGAALQLRGRFDEAEEAYRRALVADPDSADAHANLGKLLQAQGRPSAAESHFRSALAAAPGHPQALSGLAAWLDNRGRPEAALALLEDGGEAGHETAPVRARVLRHLGRADEARALLERQLPQRGLPAEAQVQLRFSLGHALEDLGKFREAYAVIREANELRRAALPPGEPEAGAGALEAAVRGILGSFDARAMGRLPRSGCTSERPLFLVGMPRSGKSLAEQILCAHPDVHGAGELTEIGAISQRLGESAGGWPEGVAAVTERMLAAEAHRYLAALDDADREAARVTDTMPFNFLHLGLIELLFPRARVVHCVRDPRDLALRCYFKNFAGRTLAFSFSTGAIGRWLAAYREAMAHWRRVSGLAIHELRYEALVADPEREIRALVDFAGLDWDPACLAFHRPGVATSAAPLTVHTPIHSREVGGWRAYRDVAGPWLDALDGPGAAP